MKTDSAGDFNFIEPTIEKLAEGVWQFGGYGLAPMSIIETEDGLIAFDTGDTKHNSELMLEAFRTVTDKPINLQAYGEVSSYPPAIFYQTAGWYDNDAEKPKKPDTD